jgi:hypothetical protein
LRDDGDGGFGGRNRRAANSGVGSSVSLSTALHASVRKRRRTIGGGGGGGECDRNFQDPKYASPSSALDVTVSWASFSSSSSSSSFDTTFGEGGGSVALLAYMHHPHAAMRTTTMMQSSGLWRIGRRENGITTPGFSRIVISRDVIFELGGVGDGRDVRLRLYGAVIIPPPRSSTAECNAERTDGDGDGEDPHVMGMLPTILCTNIFEEYPADQPPLDDVSFDLLLECIRAHSHTCRGK